MHVLEKAFIDLLRNHIDIHNSKIYTGSRYISKDITPCITLLVADERFIRRKYVEINTIEYIQKRYNAELWINIWCQTEEERQQLITQINNRILQAEANHYTTCAHYQLDETCNITGEECEALTSTNGRAVKNQCPNLEIYQSFFKLNHIPKRTFHISSITDLDELDLSEPLLRTIFKLEMDYFTYYEIGGKTFEDFIVSEELL